MLHCSLVCDIATSTLLSKMTMKKLWRKIRLYVLDIPATLVLAPIGFLLEFMVTLPFMIACELDGFFQKKT